MSAPVRTAPSGAVVPAAIRNAVIANEDDAHLEAIGAAGAMNAANVVRMQAETIRDLRKENARLASEVEGLKRHIVQMGQSG